MRVRAHLTPEYFDRLGADHLPGMFGLRTIHISQGKYLMHMEIRAQFLAPNGYLHAATIVALADSASGYACLAHLPDSAQSFTTIELKTNFLGTARSGLLEVEARAAHLGRHTQVWDANVSDMQSGKSIALFRCTQMILWPGE